jgi:ribokinase
MRPKILSLGDVAWDIFLKPARSMVWGSDVPGAADMQPGGSAANFAVWASRLGARVSLVGKIGEDWFGQLMQDYLQQQGVETLLHKVAHVRTARIGVLVTACGERSFIMDKDKSLAFQPGDFNMQWFDDCSLFFFTGYTIFTPGSLPFIREVLAEVRRRHIPLAFDPASFHLIEGYGPTRLLEELGFFDFLLLNEKEAEILLPGEPPESLLRHAAAVILKRGERGASFYAPNFAIDSPALHTHAVDTTGAGDAFDATFLVEYLYHHHVEAAMARANEIGSFVVSHVGAQPAYPQAVEVDVI